MSTPPVLGVGVIGAGRVTQAAHLPTLATLPDRFRVAHVADPDLALATEVAARAGARASDDVAALLADPAVDVVAVCSPSHLHVTHVSAACLAGKKAVLCEKPLVVDVSEAHRVSEVSDRTGVPVVVGAMHAYDPAYRSARAAARQVGLGARLVRSTVYLPSDDAFVDLSTEPVAGGRATALAAPVCERPDWTLRRGVLGLAVHSIPLVRDFVVGLDQVTFAANLRPFGYELVLTSGRQVVQLVGLVPGAWRPGRRLQVVGADSELDVSFPPSFVLAGSARARLTHGGSTTEWSSPRNGYQQEWEHVADVAHGLAAPVVPLATAVHDLALALAIADRAAESLAA